MPGDTTIGWTNIHLPDGRVYRGKTLNTVTGCDPVSRGCENCYAERFANRWKGVPRNPFEQGFALRLWPDRINIPLTWKQPSGIFVNSMSDWAHKDIPLDHTLDLFRMMCRANWHIFQLLTKRAPNMLKLVPHLLDVFEEETGKTNWPWHIWPGVSIEEYANRGRFEKLREVGAPITYVSYEPALDDLFRNNIDLTGISQIIFGGESGPHARPIDLEWARHMIAICRNQGVAVYIKQLGTVWAQQQKLTKIDYKAENMEYWPEDLRIREYPNQPNKQ